MTVAPSYRSAAIAGLWSSLGLVPVDAWLHRSASTPAIYGNVAWFVVLGVFLYLPGYFLVLGRGATRFRPDWLADPAERRRYGLVVKRVMLWVVVAGAASVVWSSLLGGRPSMMLTP